MRSKTPSLVNTGDEFTLDPAPEAPVMHQSRVAAAISLQELEPPIPTRSWSEMLHPDLTEQERAMMRNALGRRAPGGQANAQLVVEDVSSITGELPAKTWRDSPPSKDWGEAFFDEIRETSPPRGRARDPRDALADMKAVRSAQLFSDYLSRHKPDMNVIRNLTFVKAIHEYPVLEELILAVDVHCVDGGYNDATAMEMLRNGMSCRVYVWYRDRAQDAWPGQVPTYALLKKVILKAACQGDPQMQFYHDISKLRLRMPMAAMEAYIALEEASKKYRERCQTLQEGTGVKDSELVSLYLGLLGPAVSEAMRSLRLSGRIPDLLTAHIYAIDAENSDRMDARMQLYTQHLGGQDAGKRDPKSKRPLGQAESQGQVSKRQSSHVATGAHESHAFVAMNEPSNPYAPRSESSVQSMRNTPVEGEGVPTEQYGMYVPQAPPYMMCPNQASAQHHLLHINQPQVQQQTRYIPPPRTGESGSIVCFYCRAEGHTVNQCAKFTEACMRDPTRKHRCAGCDAKGLCPANCFTRQHYARLDGSEYESRGRSYYVMPGKALPHYLTSSQLKGPAKKVGAAPVL